jgi:hypothetical protein
MEKKDNSHKTWANGKKPSMKRRSEQNDYTERGIYLITIAIEGRKPLLGTLAGKVDVQEGPDKPHVLLSPWGERVKECWLAIPQYHPLVEPMKLCIMPDHIHGILFVHEKIDCHLGHVINGFKAGTRKAAREIGIITEAIPQPTKQAQNVSIPPSGVSCAEASPQPKHSPIGTLWEPGYHDRLLLHKNQLAHMLAYLDDNPRRLLIKRQHPEFFSPLGELTFAGVMMQAMGNAALLSHHQMRRLQCSRHLYQQEIDGLQQDFLNEGKAGTLIISPCISPGEQQIATACIKAHIPFIVLLVHGFPPFYKPQPLYLEACAEGRLLLMSPFQWQNEKITNMRQRCLYLNDLAQRICEEANRR